MPFVFRCILVLVDFGVQLDPLDEDGHTPIFLALQEGHKECSKSLLEAGASLDTISNVSQSPNIDGDIPSLLIKV